MSFALDFYKEHDYVDKTQQDLQAKICRPVCYEVRFESKRAHTVKKFLWQYFPPLRLHSFLHSYFAKQRFLPSSYPTGSWLNYEKDYAHKARVGIDLTSDWKFRRFSIRVDSLVVDAMLIGKESTLANKRWVLAANGNSSFYEERLGRVLPERQREFTQILTELNANGLVFNYPGVGASDGEPCSRTVVKAYRAMLHLLEDRLNGIGANVIVSFDHSLAGWTQTAAYDGHKLQPDIRYVVVKSRTFSSFAKTVESRMQKALQPHFGKVVAYIGAKTMRVVTITVDWNLDSRKAAKQFSAPMIILQTANVKEPTELTNSSQVINDGTIPEDAALATDLLQKSSWREGKKVSIIGIPERHNDHIKDTRFLTQKIKEYLGELS